jgi:hypothetical protein
MQELNVIVMNDFAADNWDMVRHLFGDDEDFLFLHPQYDMYDCLVHLEVFKSKGEARKNWKRTGKEIPPGYNEFRGIGKSKKALFIWNPVDARGTMR